MLLYALKEYSAPYKKPREIQSCTITCLAAISQETRKYSP